VSFGMTLSLSRFLPFRTQRRISKARFALYDFAVWDKFHDRKRFIIIM